MKRRDAWFSREGWFSLGYDEDSGRHYVAIPVSAGVAFLGVRIRDTMFASATAPKSAACTSTGCASKRRR